MKFDISPLNKFVFRIPYFPIEIYKKIGNEQNFDSYLKKILGTNEVKEAIYISSPEFYEELSKFLNGYIDKNDFKRINSFRYSALKFLNRMSSRPTPFGLFAGCGIGDISDNETKISVKENAHFLKKLRLDMSYLIKVYEDILSIKKNREYFKFFPNNSIYTIGDDHRYVEFNTINGNRKHSLTSFKDNEYLNVILKTSKNGAFYNELVNSIIDDDIEEEDASEFLNDLIDSKILISELEPYIVDDNWYDKQLVDILKKRIKTSDKELNMVVNSLTEVNHFLTEHKNNIIDIKEYKKITSSLKEIISDDNQKYFFQIDSEVILEQSNLNYSDIWNIKKGMRSYFQLASISNQNSNISNFKKKFMDRYESATVRLVEVLDPELGLNYGQLSEDQMYPYPLVDNIPFPSKTKTQSKFIWDNKLHYFLFNKIINACNKNENVILTTKEINNFTFDVSKIPSSLIALTNIGLDEDDNLLINFKNWGTDSANTILARFSLLNNDFKSLVKEIADHESSQISSKQILAEINHLPNSRLGNITARTKFRNYEIAYITKSNSNEKGIININDLYIMLENGKFRIIDDISKKEIIPILSNAHNFNKDTLPVYRFLADIQNNSDQDVQYMNFSLGNIPNILNHIPRIQCKNYIFRLATWKIKIEDYDSIWNLPEPKKVEYIIESLKSRNIPLNFFISFGDNKLFIDFINITYASLLLFTQELFKNKSLIIEENFYDSASNSLFKNSKGNYLNEVIIPFKNNIKENKFDASFQDHINFEIENENRTFTPGSEWVYFKIYSGIKTRDLILNYLDGFLTTLKQQGLLKKWHYIRYTDPDTHLRLRLKLKDTSNIYKVFSEFHNSFDHLIKTKKIRSVKLDTYVRELERYGGTKLINYSEDIFHIDSELNIGLLKLIQNKNLYWLLALKICDVYMNVFGIKTYDAKKDFCKGNRDWFAKEFNANKIQRRIIMQKYYEHRTKVEKIINSDFSDFNNKDLIENQINQFQLKLEKIYSSNFSDLEKKEKYSYLRSFIHMFLLRFLSAKNRIHEYLFYSILEQYFRSIAEKEKSLKK